MPNKTTNYGLTKPLATENYNINDQNGNMDIIDKGLVIYLGTTSGSANTYALSTDLLESLSEGLAICVKFHAASTAASTIDINSLGAKAIKKPGGADVTNLKVGLYTLRYDGTSFILQGEGASGNATASDLALGKTATTDAGEITGTLPVIGPEVAETINLTTEGAEYIIPYGKHSGLRKIKAAISGLIAGVIKAGVTVGGITGTFTNDATATAAQMLSGATAWIKGVLVTGNIASKAAQTYNPSTSAQTIPAGQYLSGVQTIAATTGTAAVGDVLAGKTFNSANGIGLTGTMPNNGAVNQTLAANGTYTIPAGYHNGSGKVTQSLATKGAATYTPTTSDQIIAANQYLTGVQTIKGDANLIADNIRSGKSIFGLTGTLQEGLKFATGEAYATNNGHTFKDVTNTSFGSGFFYSLNVSGLTFKPDIILCLKKGFGDTVWSYDTIYRKNPYNAGYGTIVAKAGSSQYKMLHDSDLTSVTTDAYVNSSGFRLPVDVNGSAYPFIWIALSLAGKVNLY